MTPEPEFPSLPQICPIAAKMADLKSQLRRVQSGVLPLEQAAGRVLAQDLLAFRDSPAIDVSAMDGYAFRRDEFDGSVFRICGTATAGSAPIPLSERSSVRVFTGGPVPDQADCVVRREDCNESESFVSVCLPKESIPSGLNIRRQGENARQGDLIVSQGTLLTPCNFAGAVTFSDRSLIQVYQKVRIGIVNTGDELFDIGRPIEPWQIRDSNGPFLEAMLSRHAWSEVDRMRVADQQEATNIAIQEQLERCDVLLLTGGVSMGDTDFVPDAIRNANCKIVFHRIPIRPGKPMLGAVGPNGQLVLGLPGNPLSVAVTFRRFGLELIQAIAGFSSVELPPRLPLECDSSKTLDLTWFRLVKLHDNGVLTLVPTQGSGDIASLARSDGFVEIPPNRSSAGTWPFYAW
jgi:molybdopterin molybdotransferase